LGERNPNGFRAEEGHYPEIQRRAQLGLSAAGGCAAAWVCGADRSGGACDADSADGDQVDCVCAGFQPGGPHGAGAAGPQEVCGASADRGIVGADAADGWGGGGGAGAVQPDAAGLAVGFDGLFYDAAGHKGKYAAAVCAAVGD